ncbi:bifunctional phosphopantothenoylcysteine decarboxylase/phosphopantothenate--cysteine ligase CoaBC [Mycoplasmopsis sturni]|uniref:bifunctional phosphopantothenoylcysteine decarboxylase/phosphopantothenate--cysteine ligase CoaBC n=1 Tax=Mycoplasmopsis sturni TaxID=39047 RepID=UPI00055A7EA2|nr:bifunctional phosphopantothenoylcysteine decarboxylase/phosphopantothenate--cysteine ligase CoaBC [Mycoplasmopsis sturni]
MNLLVLVTGSIAAIKSHLLVKKLIEQKHTVKVAFTEAGKEFVSLKDFTNYYDNTWYKNKKSDHIDLFKWADRIIVYPATYNTINKVANGINDNFVTNLLSIGGFNKWIVCPAMNTKMYANPILQENIIKLKKLGVTFLGPDAGMLYDGDNGIGRVVEPDFVVDFLSCKPKKKVLITFGFTKVYLDPVRTVSVFSSGKSGLALIQELAKSFDVTVINGNLEHLNTYIPLQVKVINVKLVDEYFKAVQDNIKKHDIYISLAAVSDLIFEKQKQKIKKNEDIKFNFHQGVDVLKWVSDNYPNKIKIGYALESSNLIENGRSKFNNKKLDLLVVNNSLTLGSNTSTGFFITKENEEAFKDLDKTKLAQIICQKIEEICKK